MLKLSMTTFIVSDIGTTRTTRTLREDLIADGRISREQTKKKQLRTENLTKNIKKSNE